jgi:DNA-directed RNA polymerase subunit RPC12/RpoP
MERVGDGIEFLCLSCGLQGLMGAGCSQAMEMMCQVFCPRCGGRVLTPRFEREKELIALTL